VLKLRPGRTRAVITGGAGFLGSRLCRSPLAAGTEVLCSDALNWEPKIAWREDLSQTLAWFCAQLDSGGERAARA
jgi:dTDP-D-glucose 4,6-dehydratase